MRPIARPIEPLRAPALKRASALLRVMQSPFLGMLAFLLIDQVSNGVHAAVTSPENWIHFTGDLDYSRNHNDGLSKQNLSLLVETAAVQLGKPHNCFALPNWLDPPECIDASAMRSYLFPAEYNSSDVDSKGEIKRTKKAVGARHPQMIVEFCHFFCSAHKPIHFATKSCTDCYCFDEVTPKIPARQGLCDIKCLGKPSETCDGRLRYEMHLVHYLWKDAPKGPSSCGDPAEFSMPPMLPEVVAGGWRTYKAPIAPPAKSKAVRVQMKMKGIDYDKLKKNKDLLDNLALGLERRLAAQAGVSPANVKVKIAKKKIVQKAPVKSSIGLLSHKGGLKEERPEIVVTIIVLPPEGKKLSKVADGLKDPSKLKQAAVAGAASVPGLDKVCKGTPSVSAVGKPAVKDVALEWLEIVKEVAGDANGNEFDNSDIRTLNFPILDTPEVNKGNYWVRLDFGTKGSLIQFMVPKGSDIFDQSKPAPSAKVVSVTTSKDIKGQFGKEATFCHACMKNGLKFGATCWAVVQTSDKERSCGCSGKENEGQGIYYGGYKAATTCKGQGGGFVGAKKGTTYALGNLTLEHTVLRVVRLCWCPAEDAAYGGCKTPKNFRADVGNLKVPCPKGYYTVLGDGGRAQCVFCTQGFYCIGYFFYYAWLSVLFWATDLAMHFATGTPKGEATKKRQHPRLLVLSMGMLLFATPCAGQFISFEYSTQVPFAPGAPFVHPSSVQQFQLQLSWSAPLKDRGVITGWRWRWR